MEEYGAPQLGTVTGNNDYFVLTDDERREYGIDERHLVPVCPPGTKHFSGLMFSRRDWEALRDAGDRSLDAATSGRHLGGLDGRRNEGLRRYLGEGI